jgi:N-ethylmaleimide reductase
MQELISSVGNETVVVKISPFNPYAAIVLNNLIATYNCLIEKLNKLDFAYVELMCCSPSIPLRLKMTATTMRLNYLVERFTT